MRLRFFPLNSVLRTGRAARCALVMVACATVDVVTLSAQRAQPLQQREASRASLESLAVLAERGTSATDRARAAALRDRLRRGDFRSGDQFILELEGGAQPLLDTVTVRAGQVIRVEGFADIPVGGVLRSELKEHLTREFKRFLISPRVTARPLVRVTLTGGVTRPGFYVVPYDLTVTEVIMESGGPGTNAKLEKTELRRGERTLYSANSLAAAMREGRTLDELGVVNGDVLNVGIQKPRSWSQAFQVAGIVVSVLTVVATLSQR